ncbi:hypothetical protein EG329_011421 [Mollisiaceae sp. DMI_Dod_QoI]|nr:hypothetical protein EG329_011421 [Helotiales sp. DMI_Dod_QoI]
MDPPAYTPAANKSEKPWDTRLKIIVGLDYGTTNSGISYVTSDQNSADKIEVIRQWPNGPGTIGKVPSVIAYRTENVTENLHEDPWGFSALEYNSCQWTKLLLGKDPRTAVAQGNNFCSLPRGKTAKDVVRDYLQGLYQYLIERLQRHDESTFNITPIQFWITVPAMWSDAAKTATIEAAQGAGFGSRMMDTIHIITEPEAAALSVLMPRVGLGAVTGFENGSQNVLICDCGGGTVDIVTYKVRMRDGRLEFQELLVGVGAMCGSTFIDRNFDAWMTKKFGSAYTKLSVEERGPSSHFFRQFETVKKNFTGPNHTKRMDVWPINMSASKSSYYDKRNFTVKLQSADMLELFDRPINEIIELVESQLDAASRKGEAIHQLFLVGGFGESPYLNLKLKEWCLKHDIKLSCPPSCQEAIVKGAALRGLEILTPTVRLARRNYGYGISKDFREGHDDENDAYYSEWDGTKRCGTRVQWFLSKGDPIENFKAKVFEIGRTSYEDSQDLQSSFTVYNCDTDDKPEYSTHYSMQKMGKVTFSFTEDEMKTGRSKMKNGRKMWKLNYEIEVDLFSDRGDLQFNSIVNGTRKDNKATIQFEQKFDAVGHA